MRDDDEQLRGYLLGRLDEEERSRLEERLIREEDLFETAEAVEADLLDDYVHDRLAPEERKQIAFHLASSPRVRERLALIRGLGRIDKERNVLPFPVARRELSHFERAAAMAAMLTIAVLGFQLATERAKLVQPSVETATPAVPMPTPTPRVPPVMTPPSPEVVIAESTPPETPLPQPPAPWVIQLALSTVRGEEEIPVENVPPEKEHVQLHLQLLEGDESRYTFQVVVRRAGSEVFQATDLKPREIDRKWTLVLDLGPNLPEGPYEVEVSGVTSSGGIEPIAYKELEITRNDLATADTPD